MSLRTTHIQSTLTLVGLRAGAGAYGDSGVGDDGGYEAHTLTKALQYSQDGSL